MTKPIIPTAEETVFNDHLSGRVVSLPEFLKFLDMKCAAYDRAMYPDLFGRTPWRRFTATPMRRYVRIVEHRGDARREDFSVFCFIERETGKIYRPRSWSHPYPHPRGSVFDPDHSWHTGLWPHGPKRLDYR